MNNKIDSNLNSLINNKPIKCIDPIMKFCQDCEYGWIKYPNWVETREDLDGCSFDSGCIYGFENDNPTMEDIEEFKKYIKDN